MVLFGTRGLFESYMTLHWNGYSFTPFLIIVIFMLEGLIEVSEYTVIGYENYR